VCVQEECEDADKLEALLSLVPSSVYSKLTEISRIADISFDQCCERLKQYITDEPSAGVALRMLRAARQEPGETFRSFVDRLLRLAKIAHPDSQPLAERETCLQAASNTSCPKLQADLLYESPETLEELFKLFRKRKAAEECRVASVLAAVSDEPAEVAASFDLTAIESRIAAIERSIAQLAQRESSTRKFNGECYSCGKYGHLARFCKTPKRSEGSTQPQRNQNQHLNG
jgi:hypothetical protein